MLKIDNLSSSKWFNKMFKNRFIMSFIFFIFIFGMTYLFLAGFFGLLIKEFLILGIIFTILAVLYSFLFVLWFALIGYKLEKGLEVYCKNHSELKEEQEGFYQIRVLLYNFYLYMIKNQ